MSESVGKQREEKVDNALSLSRKRKILKKKQTHQGQVLRGSLLDRRAQVGVEVDDVLEVEAELGRVLVEGVTEKVEEFLREREKKR